MIGLYRLDYIPMLLFFILLFISFVLALFNLAYVVRNRSDKKSIIKALYYLSIVFTIFIEIEMIASMFRHLSTNNFVYDYYFVLRYFIIIPIGFSIAYMILYKRLYCLAYLAACIMIMPFWDNVFHIYYSIPFIISALYIFGQVFWTFLIYIHIRRTRITTYSIKEALDKLPLGIIISDYSKRIIFINEMMKNILEYNHISSRIKLIDLWHEVKELDTVFRNRDLAMLEYNNHYYMFSFDIVDKNEKSFYQIKCSDITNEINTLDEIKKMNSELIEQGKQLSEYISNLENLEREKALIRIKSKVHDILAQRLSIIHQYLDNDNLNLDILELKKLINDMFNDIKENNMELESLLEGIKESYGMIGMDIEFSGNFDSLPNFLSILKIVREAATNALRHGKATKLYVKRDGMRITISNNGIDPKNIKKGNGLNGMVFEAKEAGYSIDILNSPYRIVIYL